MEEKPSAPWWGTFQIEENQTARWCIGPLRLWIERRAQEIRVFSDASRDALESTVQMAMGTSLQPLPLSELAGPGAQLSRFGFRQAPEAITLTPMVADRPLVIRPVTPFYLLPGEEVTLYISTSLWVRISAGESDHTLIEIPTHRPSDTWFGPSTQLGELCYASKTLAHVRLEDVAYRPHRAVTALSVHNRADDALFLERMNLPIPHLSLYADARCHLWTQTVTLVREEGTHPLGSVRLGNGAPPEALSVRNVAGARLRADKNLLVRAFGALFG